MKFLSHSARYAHTAKRRRKKSCVMFLSSSQLGWQTVFCLGQSAERWSCFSARLCVSQGSWVSLLRPGSACLSYDPCPSDSYKESTTLLLLDLVTFVHFLHWVVSDEKTLEDAGQSFWMEETRGPCLPSCLPPVMTFTYRLPPKKPRAQPLMCIAPSTWTNLSKFARYVHKHNF